MYFQSETLHHVQGFSGLLPPQKISNILPGDEPCLDIFVSRKSTDRWLDCTRHWRCQTFLLDEAEPPYSPSRFLFRPLHMSPISQQYRLVILFHVLFLINVDFSQGPSGTPLSAGPSKTSITKERFSQVSLAGTQGKRRSSRDARS